MEGQLFQILYERVMGDSQYDANALYDQAAGRGYQLVAPAQKKHRALGHRRHSPHRLRGRSMLEDPMAGLGQPAALGTELVRRRTVIERDFAHEVTPHPTTNRNPTSGYFGNLRNAKNSTPLSEQ